MLEVARAHFGDRIGESLLRQALRVYDEVRKTRAPEDHEPSVAEFLDIIAAAATLNMAPEGSDRWEQIVEFTLSKPAPSIT
jgi:hypothetical protein